MQSFIKHSGRQRGGAKTAAAPCLSATFQRVSGTHLSR